MEGKMHETIIAMQEVVAKGREEDILPLLAEDVTFLPPTYWKTWTGREPVAAVLGHVGRVFSEFKYRRVMGGKSSITLFVSQMLIGEGCKIVFGNV